MAYTGRRQIISSVREVTGDNVLVALQDAMATHIVNSGEIDYLWNYQKGQQPILNRVKTVRPEIKNTIVENRANEIIEFKLGYICGDPIQYVSRNGGETVSESVNRLNDYMYAENKFAKDKELFEWILIGGTGYRAVFPSEIGATTPFEIYTLDPRSTFVAYSNDLRKTPVFACTYSVDKHGFKTYYIYTKDKLFVIENELVASVQDNYSGIPIYEYVANTARLGAFEVVLPLLDALNQLASNRLDGVEQFIQSLLIFENCDIDKDTFQGLKDMGGIKLKTIVDGLKADVRILTSELDQTQSQVLKEDIKAAIVEICGLPNRNGGSSTSDTGQAVVFRDGWSSAEGRAKEIEAMFKKTELEMLKHILMLCENTKGFGLDLTVADVDMHFTRRNYEAIQSKCQVLIQMLNNPRIHPELAFSHSGMFTDPEEAYLMSEKYYQEQMQKWEIPELDNEDEDVQEA